MARPPLNSLESAQNKWQVTGAGCRYEQSTEAGSGDEDYGVMCPPRRPRQDWRLRTETQERPGSESPGVTAHHTHLR